MHYRKRPLPFSDLPAPDLSHVADLQPSSDTLSPSPCDEPRLRTPRYARRAPCARDRLLVVRLGGRVIPACWWSAFHSQAGEFLRQRCASGPPAPSPVPRGGGASCAPPRAARRPLWAAGPRALLRLRGAIARGFAPRAAPLGPAAAARLLAAPVARRPPVPAFGVARRVRFWRSSCGLFAWRFAAALLPVAPRLFFPLGSRAAGPVGPARARRSAGRAPGDRSPGRPCSCSAHPLPGSGPRVCSLCWLAGVATRSPGGPRRGVPVMSWCFAAEAPFPTSSTLGA